MTSIVFDSLSSRAKRGICTWSSKCRSLASLGMTAELDHSPHARHDFIHGEPELLVDPLVRRRRTETIEAHHHALAAHPPVPALGRRRLDRQSLHAFRENRVPV